MMYSLSCLIFLILAATNLYIFYGLTQIKRRPGNANYVYFLDNLVLNLGKINLAAASLSAFYLGYTHLLIHPVFYSVNSLACLILGQMFIPRYWTAKRIKWASEWTF